MTNRKLVLGLIGAYVGFVFGVATLGSPAHLLGALNFFAEDSTATERLAEFDDDGDSIPDLINGPRILEIFRSASEILSPLVGRSAVVPGMIRLDPAFFMPESGSPEDLHGAAPVPTDKGMEAETEEHFSVVEPQWAPEEIRVSNEFDGGSAEPGIYLVPRTAISPSSSLPATLLMPPAPSAPPTVTAPPSSTPPAVTASPSSTPPVTSAPPVVSAPPSSAPSISSTPPVVTAPPSSTPPASTPPVTTSSSTPMMPSSSMTTTTTQASSSMSMDCDFDGDVDDICTPVCQMYWTDRDGDGDRDPPTPPCS